MDQKSELTPLSQTQESPPPGFFFDLAAKLNKKCTEFLQVARLKLSNATVLYALPKPEKWLPLLRIAFCELHSFISYGRADMPMTVGIETIALCDNRCPYCPVSLPEFSASRETKIMEEEIFKLIIDQLSELPRRGVGRGFNGVLHLNGYGEPLLDKKIVERVAYAREKLPEARIGFFSNGNLLTEKLFLSLVRAGINEIILTPHTGPFSQDLIDLEKRYRHLGIIKLRPPLTAFANRGILKIPEEKLQRPTKRCVHPTYALEITADGAVIFCSGDPLISQPMGRVTESSLMKIWDNADYRRLRLILRHGKVKDLPAVCRACRRLPT